MSKSFEDCLDFIENKLGLELWGCQKALLRKQYENPNYYYCANRFHGLHMVYQTMQILKEQVEKENKHGN